MKKVKFFGKELSVFAIALLSLAALGTAALVPYLSGLVVGNVDVDSPFLIEIKNSAGDFVTGEVSLGTIYGGGTLENEARVTNRLDRMIRSNESAVVITIDSTEDIDEGEITGIRLKNGGDWVEIPLESTAIVDGNLVIIFGLEAESEEVANYPIQFDLALNTKPSEYDFNAQVNYIPELPAGSKIIQVNENGFWVEVTP